MWLPYDIVYKKTLWTVLVAAKSIKLEEFNNTVKFPTEPNDPKCYLRLYFKGNQYDEDLQ